MGTFRSYKSYIMYNMFTLYLTENYRRYWLFCSDFYANMW